MAKVTREAGFGIGIPVRPELDEKSSVEVLKKLAKLKASWTEVSKSSKISLKDIQEMSVLASDFGKKLSKATQTSYKEISKLGDALGKAMEEAEHLQDALKHAKTPEDQKKITEELSQVSDSVLNLKKQIDDFGTSNKRQRKELDKVIEGQKKYQSSLKEAGKYSAKDSIKDVLSSLRSGGAKGLVGAGKAAASGVQGGLARTAMAGGAGTSEATAVGSAAGGLMKAAGALGAIAVSLGAVWEFVKSMSDHQTKLNKSLLAGVGTANDFTTSSENYRKVVDEIRSAAQDSAFSLLKFGANSQTALEAINAYAKESTGSLMKTRDVMNSLGDKDTAAGMAEFTRNAVAYGKALGMETNEVAGMMGKFVGEVGYGAGQVQDLMGDIVKAAATSGMPVHKFMNIFKETTTDVEIFTNRIEELAGTMKLLSKNMSPSDVKRFMDAFKKGFTGKSFKDRLGSVLVAGIPEATKIATKDFDQKAKTLASKMGDLAPDFMKAFNSGSTDAMNEVLIKAKAKGMSGTDIGEAQKLMGAKQDLKGGAPGVASATKGLSMWSTVKMMGAEMKRFGMGGRISGINEVVAEKRGYNQDQIDAMNQLISSMNLYQKSLKEYGTTGSKSMDAALKKIMAQSLGKPEDQIKPEDMAKASEDEIAAAAEESNKSQKTAKTALDLATQQVSLTTSLSEKIDNVIAFLLEKIYKVLSPILDVLDNLWMWLTGDKDQQKMIKGVQSLNDIMQSSMFDAGVKEQYKMVADAVTKGMQSGKTGAELGKSVLGKEGSLSLESLRGMDPTFFGKMAERQGMDVADSVKWQEKIFQALKSGNLDEVSNQLAKLPGQDMSTTLMELAGANKAQVSEDAKKRAGEKAATRRAGKEEMKITDVAESPETKAMDDAVTELHRIGGDSKDAATSLAAAAGSAGSASVATTSVKPSTDAKHASSATEAVRDSVDQASKDQVQQEADIYDGIKDVAGILKKGIKYEAGWMGTKWKNVLKEATLDSFRTALLEYFILEQKMADGGEQATKMQEAIVKYGKGLSDKGAGTSDIIGGFGVSGSWDDYINKRVLGTRQTGGPIPDTGLYKLHSGEYVLPPGAAAAAKGGSGPTIVYMTVNGTNLTPDQLKGVVYEAMDEAARRH